MIGRGQLNPRSLHDDANRSASVGALGPATCLVTLLNVLSKSRAPQMMGIARIQIFRGGVHYQEFLAKRALPGYSAELPEECEVMSHVPSITLGRFLRNLRW